MGHKRTPEWQRLAFLDRFYPKRTDDRDLGSMLAASEYYNEEEDHKMQELYYAGLTVTADRKQNLELLSTLSRARLHAGKRTEHLYSWYDRRPDGTLRCIYTDEVLMDAKGVYQVPVPRQDRLPFNEEHSFPQSWQQGCGAGTGRDAHHIFASSKASNGSRGACALGAPQSDGATPHWLEHLGYTKWQMPYARRLVEPHHNAGLLARAALYTMVTYPQVLHLQQIGEDSLLWLQETAAREPVSLFERHRNAAVSKVQGNRNPFVDHPEWVALVDFRAALRQEAVDKLARREERRKQKEAKREEREIKKVAKREEREIRKVVKLEETAANKAKRLEEKAARRIHRAAARASA